MLSSRVANIFVFLLWLSPTLNVVSRDLWIASFLVMTVLLAFLFNPFSKADLAISIAIMFSLFIRNYDQIFFKFVPFLIVGYIGIKVGTKEINIKNALLALLLIHLALSLIQLLGVTDIIYSWSTYDNELHPYPSSDFRALYLSQFRPSGIFPAPTYVSYFLLTVFCIIHSSPNFKSCQIPFLFCTVLSGSTMGLTLAVWSIVISSPLRARINNLVWVLLIFLGYRYFWPDFFEYNFSISDLKSSLIERPLSESILTQRPYVFLSFVTLSLIFVLTSMCYQKWKLNLTTCKHLLLGFACIFLPIILHDTNGTAIGQFMIGVGFGLLKSAHQHYLSQYQGL